jgi:very-short-patch-repair endonuclease
MARHTLAAIDRRDAKRDAWLAARGLQVLRYPAVDALTNLDDVVRQIRATALQRRGRIEG